MGDWFDSQDYPDDEDQWDGNLINKKNTGRFEVIAGNKEQAASNPCGNKGGQKACNGQSIRFFQFEKAIFSKCRLMYMDLGIAVRAV